MTLAGLLAQVSMLVLGLYTIVRHSIFGGVCIFSLAVGIEYFVTQPDAQALAKMLLLSQQLMAMWAIAHSKHDKPDSIHSKTRSLHNKHVSSTSSHKSHMSNRQHASLIPRQSVRVLERVFGRREDEEEEEGWLPLSSTPDLRYRSREEVRQGLERVFQELPSSGFLSSYRNPCWHEHDGDAQFYCLPYAYILGQPKCGTTDLFSRLGHHPQVTLPKRKEIRWLTRGEFTRNAMAAEENNEASMDASAVHWSSRRLSPQSSLLSFANEFALPAGKIRHNPKMITIDGGPHTFWWPTQSPDGSALPDEIPPPQILRELQPRARFLLTLQDPVARMYSDYHFLDSNMLVHDMNVKGGKKADAKSAKDFHVKAVDQITRFGKCVSRALDAALGKEKDKRRRLEPSLARIKRLIKALPRSLVEQQQGAPVPTFDEGDRELMRLWFRASQDCAHDRSSFAEAGSGRLSIGLYALYYEKWLENFPPSQFLAVRLEDFRADPHAYMQRVFSFLRLESLDSASMQEVVSATVKNKHRASREEMLPQTEVMLRRFYQPYNDFLAAMLQDASFRFLPASADAGDGLNSSVVFSHSTTTEPKLKLKVFALDGGKWSTPLPRADPVPVPVPGAPKARRLGSAEANRHGADLHRRRDHVSAEEDSEEEGKEAEEEEEDNVVFLHHRTNPASASSSVPGAGKPKMPPLVLRPRSFSTDGLPPAPVELNAWLRTGLDKHKRLIIDRSAGIEAAADPERAAMQLCTAAFALDLAAVKYLLYDVGIPATLADPNDSDRTAFHCLSLSALVAEAHSQSLIFALLKNHSTYLTEYLDPPILMPSEPHSQSVDVRRVLDALETQILRVARWLAAAGASASALDRFGTTPLHHAASSGQLRYLDFLLEQRGVHANVSNSEGRTPAFFAAMNGHAEAVRRLVGAGADLHVADEWGVSAMDVVGSPGPISAEDALNLLGVKQRPVKQLKGRLANPELNASEEGGWFAGTGGWSTTRLPGFEGRADCEIDQIDASEVTEDSLFRLYVARSTPVLVRGLLKDWPAAHRFSRDVLLKERGKVRVSVSDIPYAEKFGGHDHADMTLASYLEAEAEHRVVGGALPWYVFRSHPVPNASEAAASFVPLKDVPTPASIQACFDKLAPVKFRGRSGEAARQVFINAQWALGAEGTGAPVHFHNTAWNALVYGAKKWVMYPPSHRFMSNRHIKDFLDTDQASLAARGLRARTCIQTAGDVVIVPEGWSHGVYNIQQSVAVATESRWNEYRIKPWGPLLSRTPMKNV